MTPEETLKEIKETLKYESVAYVTQAKQRNKEEKKEDEKEVCGICGEEFDADQGGIGRSGITGKAVRIPCMRENPMKTAMLMVDE